ncbi:methyltransferase family protein [Actomonas aquatica]|uniref:Isoprenylcysteine carboxylmethyltransferase family protein n=1 Tax=Actomonas aquatica TaxID=2866162 RepID=A0ABZ1CGX1_9BACT|nr:isoprenylcysteine carboxylmethyltransferase family protein [Opitutus sp. WL0086]WRQ89520.1 isoprenylcysteine carboxylmethyltransferase family protein [Opitutus sp. WL0086]
MPSSRPSPLLYPPVWFLLQLGLTVLLIRTTESAWWSTPAWLRAFGLGIGFAGVIWAATAILTVARHRTAVLPYRDANALITTCVFRWSRNPIYLGEAFILAGVALRSGELLPWVAVPLFMIGLTRGPIRWEESTLRQRFGPQFEAYAARTRRWL